MLHPLTVHILRFIVNLSYVFSFIYLVQNYTNFAEVYDGLIREEVQGMLIDTYEAGSKRDRFKDPRIHVRTIFDYKSTYGVVLAGSSTKLMQCSRSYMRAHQDEMYEHIGKFISSIQVNMLQVEIISFEILRILAR